MLAPGDILFFTTTDPGPSHVAIAIGGDQFVHAPSSTGVVRVEHLSSTYWSPRYPRRPRRAYAALNWPFRINRRDVSFRNWRTCRSSSV